MVKDIHMQRLEVIVKQYNVIHRPMVFLYTIVIVLTYILVVC